MARTNTRGPGASFRSGFVMRLVDSRERATEMVRLRRRCGRVAMRRPTFEEPTCRMRSMARDARRTVPAPSRSSCRRLSDLDREKTGASARHLGGTGGRSLRISQEFELDIHHAQRAKERDERTPRLLYP